MATEFKLPELGENINEGDIIKILVKVGDDIQKDQPIIEIETDKAAIEVPSSINGKVKEILVKAGHKAKVGQTILTVESNGKALNIATSVLKGTTPVMASAKTFAPVAAVGTTSNNSTSVGGEPIPASPSTRRLAREMGIDLRQVVGKGPQGLITNTDILNRHSMGSIPTGKPASVASTPLPDFSRYGTIETEAMSNIRRKTAENLAHAWATIPHVTHFEQADITDLENFRSRFGKLAEQAGGKLTITAVLLKVVGHALKKFPKFNASVDMANNRIIFKKFYHIGIAVDTDRGLLVPVVRDVDKKNILALSSETTQIARKARDKKLSLEEMQGGTFTITNLGSIGAKQFAPIINAPEVAILAVSRGSVQPVFKNDQFIPRHILPLALSYDHRLIDGADAARFMRYIVETLEQPLLLTLEA